jgi:hypothetical protein
VQRTGTREDKAGRTFVIGAALLVVATLALCLVYPALGAGKRNAELAASVRAGDRAAVRELLREGADPNACPDRGESFLDRLCHLFRPDPCSTTLLITATEAGDVQMVSLLLEYGANLHAKDDQGRTALDVAAAPTGWVDCPVGRPMMCRSVLEEAARPNP